MLYVRRVSAALILLLGFASMGGGSTRRASATAVVDDHLAERQGACAAAKVTVLSRGYDPGTQWCDAPDGSCTQWM
jgi:hypothetical protein